MKKFGDDFLNWVKNDLHKSSKDFTQANWDLYWEGFFVTLQQDIYDLLNNAEGVIKDVENSSINIDFNNYVLSDVILSKQILQSNVSRMIEAYNKINHSKNKLENNSNQEKIDYFIKMGFYHIGRATFLESYVKMASGLKDLNSAYGVSFVITVDGEGNTDMSDIQVIGSEEQQATEHGTLATALYIAPYLGPYATAIVYTVYAIYKMWDISERKEEYNDQLKKYNEGLQLLPKKILSLEESYEIYKSSFREKKEKYLEINKNLHGIIKTLIEILKGNIIHNSNQILLIDKILNKDNLNRIVSDYNRQIVTVRSIFDNYMLMTTFEELLDLDYEQKHIRSSISSDNLKDRLIKTDSYLNVLKENYHIYKSLLDNPLFIPLFEYLNRKLEHLKKEVNLVEENFSDLRPHNKIFTEDIDLNEIKSIVESSLYSEVENESVYLVDKNANKTKHNSLKNLKSDTFWRMTSSRDYSNPTYGLEIGRSESDIRNQYFRNGDFTNLSGSRFDGGFNTDLRRDSYDLDKMKYNISLRINSMKKNETQISEVSAEWREKNIKIMESLSGDLTNASKTVKNKRKALYEKHKKILNQYRAHYESIFTSSFNAESIKKYFEGLDMNDNILALINPSDIRPEGKKITGLNFRDKFYGNKSLLRRKLTHAEYQFRSRMSSISDRILENLSNGERDFVFGSSREEFKQANKLGEVFLDAASIFFNEEHDFYIRNPSLSIELGNKLLENVKSIEYYSMGFLSEFETEQKFYLSPEDIREKLKLKVSNYEYCDNTSDLSNSDCNRFTSRFLNDFYGVSDFYNNPDGSDLSTTSGIRFMNTYDMNNYVRESEEWVLIGNASDQTSLTLSGTLSNMKFAVIALRPGHVCPILPGAPTFWSGTWQRFVPFILNYSQVDSGDEVNIELNVPLSRAWRAGFMREIHFYYRKK